MKNKAFPIQLSMFVLKTGFISQQWLKCRCYINSGSLCVSRIVREMPTLIIELACAVSPEKTCLVAIVAVAMLLFILT